MKIVLLTTLLAFSTVQITDTAFAQQMTKQEIKAQMKAEKSQKKKEKEKSSSSSVVVVSPTPVVTPAPTPVVTQPSPTPVVTKPTIDPYTQSQIDKALSRPQVHPLANCTYCAAHAASVGDLDLVSAIGATYTPPTQSAVPVETTTSSQVENTITQ